MASFLNDKMVLGCQGALFSGKMAHGFHLLPNRRDSLGKVRTYLECATGTFSSKPRGEESGRIEVVLKVAYYLGGGNGSGLVDCYRSRNKPKEWVPKAEKQYQRHLQSSCPLVQI